VGGDSPTDLDRGDVGGSGAHCIHGVAWGGRDRRPTHLLLSCRQPPNNALTWLFAVFNVDAADAPSLMILVIAAPMIVLT
jgi:hypothetical protein